MLDYSSDDAPLDNFSIEKINALDIGDVFTDPNSKYRVLRYIDCYIITGIGFIKCTSTDEVIEAIDKYLSK